MSSSSRTSTSAPSTPTARSRASASTGKVFTIGWNSSKGQLDAHREGHPGGRSSTSAGPTRPLSAAPACAQFLKNGVILPNTQTLKAVTKDGVAQARKELDKTMSAK